MNKNIVFNFIKTHGNNLTVKSFKNCYGLVVTQDKNEVEYCRFDLKTPKKLMVIKNQGQELRLTSHHISIYKTEQEYNPSLSQYHYTAYFSDTEGRNYQLHVYFNNEDELTQMPVLSLEELKGVFTPVSVEAIQDNLTALAITYTKPIIEELRNQLFITIDQLDKDYESSELKASMLSLDVEQNYPAYMQRLIEMEDILKQLGMLVSHQQYQKKLELIHSMRKVIQVNCNLMKNDRVLVDSLVALDEKTTENDSLVVMSPPSFFKPLPEKKHSVELSREVEYLIERHHALSSKKEIDKAKELGELYAQIQLILLTCNKTGSDVLPSIIKLQKLLQDIRKDSEQLCTYLLLKEQFEAATQLPELHSILGTKYFNLALCTRKPKLLEFVITHSHSKLVNQSLTINNLQYSSPVHYCVKVNNAKMQMQECLAVLIKLGASVLVNGEDNLPIAYHLLKNDHPLQKAMVDNREKTIDSVAFNQQLNIALKAYLTNPHSDKKLRVEVQQHIRIYTNVINSLLPGLKSPIGQRFKNTIIEFSKNIIKVAPDLMDKINQDPVIAELKKQHEKAHKIYIGKISKKQYREHLKIGNDAIKSLDGFLQTNDWKTLDMDDLIEGTRAFLQDEITIYNKLSEVLDIQKNEMQPKTYNKQRKELKKKEKLLNEINALSEKYSCINSNKLVEIDALDNMMRSLAKLKSEMGEIANQFQNLRAKLELEPTPDSQSQPQENVAGLLTHMLSLFVSGDKNSAQKDNLAQSFSPSTKKN